MKFISNWKMRKTASHILKLLILDYTASNARIRFAWLEILCFVHYVIYSIYLKVIGYVIVQTWDEICKEILYLILQLNLSTCFSPGYPRNCKMVSWQSNNRWIILTCVKNEKPNRHLSSRMAETVMRMIYIY